MQERLNVALRKSTAMIFHAVSDEDGKALTSDILTACMALVESIIITCEGNGAQNAAGMMHETLKKFLEKRSKVKPNHIPQ